MTVYVRLPDGNLMTRKEHEEMLKQEQEQSVQVAPVKPAAKVEVKPTVLETKDDNKV